MAAQFGVKSVAVCAYLLKHCPDEWISAQRAKATAMKEDGEQGLDESRDALDIAIAREKIRAGQWDLERIDRRNYGRDEAFIRININNEDLGDRLRRARERTLEHEPGQETEVKEEG